MKVTIDRTSLTSALMVLVAGTGVCSAGTITYQVDQTGIGFDSGSVIGTIVTDGNSGTLAATDILDWNPQATCLVFLSCAGSNFTLTVSNSTVTITGTSGLSATATELLYDYDVSGMFEITNTATPSEAWALGLTSAGMTFEEILQTGADGNAAPQSGTHTIGTVIPEPSTFGPMLIAFGLLLGLRKRMATLA